MPPEQMPFEDEKPLAMQLDLLVDEELSDAQRRDLLRELERSPQHWRDLSLRFLEHQIERKSVRDLMAGGQLIPADFAAPAPAHLRWGGTLWNAGFRRRVAAALLLAAASAVITFYAIQPKTSLTPPLEKSYASLHTELPGESLNLTGSVAVDVPLVDDAQTNARVASFSSADTQVQRSPRRSIVIQSDGTGNAVLIPVNTLPIKVY